MALHRFRRDLETAGKAVAWAIPLEEGDKALGVEGNSLVENGKVILEEYIFDFKADGQAKVIAEWLASHAFPQGPEYPYCGAFLTRQGSVKVLETNHCLRLFWKRQEIYQ